MFSWIYIVTILTGIILVLLSFKLSSLAWRSYGLIGFILFTICGLAAYLNLIGSPKYIGFENLTNQKFNVIAEHIDLENELIYLWLLPEGETQPVYYKIKLTVRIREQLESARGRARREGLPIELEFGSFDENLYKETPLIFKIKRPPPLPRKIEIIE